MGVDTLQLLAAMALVAVPALLAGRWLPQQRIGGRPPTRAEAQAIGAMIGLVIGVGFLWVSG